MENISLIERKTMLKRCPGGYRVLNSQSIMNPHQSPPGFDTDGRRELAIVQCE
jgi:hypothetical protein